MCIVLEGWQTLSLSSQFFCAINPQTLTLEFLIQKTFAFPESGPNEKFYVALHIQSDVTLKIPVIVNTFEIRLLSQLVALKEFHFYVDNRFEIFL